ncbi:MAG: ComF family protein [Pacificimonas sp.]|jgi:ComF family protein|nr:ComF family protein [Pacificimonas sp.]
MRGNGTLDRVGGIAATAGRSALDLLLPPRCPACREIVDADGRFCERCFPELGFITAPQCACCGLPFDIDAGPDALCADCAGTERPYTSARAAFRYEGAAVPVLLGFKHGGRVHLASVMAAQMLRLFAAAAVDIIVPVPLDRTRLRTRGYNQAGLIARALGKRTGLPVAVDGLKRVKPTKSTAGLSRAGRFRAAQGAFAGQRNRVGNRRVLLVDDVMTTGATVESAARALRRSGRAADVRVVTFARALST